jgi:hypothetical protein
MQEMSVQKDIYIYYIYIYGYSFECVGVAVWARDGNEMEHDDYMDGFL